MALDFLLFYIVVQRHKEKRVIVLEIKEPSVPENNGFKLSLNGRRIKKEDKAFISFSLCLEERGWQCCSS